MTPDANGAVPPQRIVVVMVDGLGLDYYEQSPMPALKSWARAGVFAPVRAVLPTVTNSNNVSICCGSWPERHGVIGNSYLDETTGEEEYLENGDLVLAPTLFERAATYGVRSALLTSKKKTTTLLGRGAAILLAGEAPTPEWTARLGEAPPIYSREINEWLLRATIDVLRDQPDVGCLYVHTTDYAMHMWPPEATESKEHLARMDALLAEAARVAPDAAFLVSADHGMNFKTRCWDLEKACAARGTPVRMAISAERDKYLRHHRGFGGTAWVHLKAPADAAAVATTLRALPGVESVLTRAEAARMFHLMPERIGDLVVLGDRETVFGHLDAEMETLPAGYRTHGSLHEMDVPVIIHNAHGVPPASWFHNNLDLARWLYPDPVGAGALSAAVGAEG
jgi:phosphonoacetate hydrolase